MSGFQWGVLIALALVFLFAILGILRALRINKYEQQEHDDEHAWEAMRRRE